MAVRKQGDKWIADVTNRATRFRTKRTFKTKKEAVQAEAKLKLSSKKIVSKASIEKALADYIKTDGKTLKDFNGMLSKARAIRPYIKDQTFENLGAVAQVMKEEFLDKGLKPATINRRLALLKRITTFAYQKGAIEHNLKDKIQLLPGEVQRHYYLSSEQVHSLADLCPRTGGLIRIAAFTGLRRSELLNLKPEQFTKNWIALSTNTKTSKPRLVPIPSNIQPDIDSYHWPLDKIYNQTLRTEFEKARKLIKLEHIRFHDLRHTYASLLVQNGATLQHVGKILGHSTIQMTNRYAHLLDENLQEIAKKLAALGTH
jgi:integrase